MVHLNSIIVSIELFPARTFWAHGMIWYEECDCCNYLNGVIIEMKPCLFMYRLFEEFTSQVCFFNRMGLDIMVHLLQPFLFPPLSSLHHYLFPCTSFRKPYFTSAQRNISFSLHLAPHSTFLNCTRLIQVLLMNSLLTGSPSSRRTSLAFNSSDNPLSLSLSILLVCPLLWYTLLWAWGFSFLKTFTNAE